ncbi:tyrosine recombinase XerC [Paenibacillus albidus]|uniref:Tyrosine recombinase XerC n=1 Tax=Paenibacillus albidus TaxID=2041023 RepID=A0A917FWF7_9BACL|nr:tyrosine-type recombinase/integrase [Paenibacillus albidus]GGG07321.1 tyrosine recombinase XerC [Paenibacillus albidus]
MHDMDFNIEVNITPDVIAEMYQIDVTDFLNLIEGKKKLSDEKTILFVIEDYISILKLNKKKSPITLEFYTTILKSFAQFLISTGPEFKMMKLTENLFHQFLATCKPLKGDELRPGTINTYAAIISNLMKFAYTRKYISDELRIEFQRNKDVIVPKYIPDKLLPALLNAAKKGKWPFLNFALIYFFLGTGCRVSEVVNLRICDFNIYEDLIFIRKGKGQKERYVPMYPEVKKVVLNYLARTGCHNWDIRNTEYLFSKRCLDTRKPLSIKNIQYMITQIFEAIGVKGSFTLHSFRHTFAVNALKEGMAIYDLQEILGHENIETTRIYTKRHPSDLKNAVLKYPFPLEKLLQSIMGIGDRSND